jgi:uncharacterized protein YbjQ (UPF0145 family)
MILVNTPTIAGKEIKEVLGIVRGNTVHSKHLGKDIGAGLKTLIGGEIKAYTEMLTNARDDATNRMIDEAEKLGADAIVNVRYTTAQTMAAAAEILAYGTAVKLL